MLRISKSAVAAATIGITIVTSCGGAEATRSSSGGTPLPSPTIQSPAGASRSLPPSSPDAPSTSATPSEDPNIEWHAIDCRGDECRVDYVPDADPAADPPGWPVLVPGMCRGLVRAVDGTVVAACDSPDGGMVHRITPAGDSILPAMRVGDAIASVYENLFTISCGDSRPSVQITGDGSVLVAVIAGVEARIVTMQGLGGVADGPALSFPGDAPAGDGIGGNGCRGFTVGTDGAVLAWGYTGVDPEIELTAARTEFIVYEASGDPRPGWPRGSRGASSRPVLHGDGSVSYVSATGRVWRHERNGEIVAGAWPYELATRHAPYATPDGRIVVIDETPDGPFVVSLERDGNPTPGWPVRLPDAIETRCLFGDTPCLGDIEPLATSDGRVYVALATGSIVAFDQAGRVPPGWPVHLGGNAHALHLAEDAQMRIVVRGVVCRDGDCQESASQQTWTIDRSGYVSQ